MDTYEIEQEYQKMVDWHDEQNAKSSKNHLAIREVLQIMFDRKDKKIWWWSWEFIGQTNSKGAFLSHRAPARASDLAIHYPELVEDRKVGRFKVYRLRTENMDTVLEYLEE